MSANIDTSTGQPAIAFRGSRDDIWHRLGAKMAASSTVDQWASAAGLDWTASKVRAFADLTGMAIGSTLDSQFKPVDGTRFVVRSDNGHVLGCVSDRYQPVQPRDVLDWFQAYISVDDRFQLDVAGALKQGEIIWATATYNGGMTVADDQHVARLLMTTTFDGSGATINRATMTRVVCNNTLDAALADNQKSLVRTRHSTKFDPERVGRELATVASGFAAYKVMGEAMATAHLANDMISKVFKACLDIPFDAKKEDISTRKYNQFQDLNNAYGATVREGTEAGTAWAALNAVTRYVDHDKSSRATGGNPAEARFVSAQFGQGAAMKARAVEVICELSDIDLLRAVAQRTSDANDVSAMLRQPFVPSMGK